MTSRSFSYTEQDINADYLYLLKIMNDKNKNENNLSKSNNVLLFYNLIQGIKHNISYVAMLMADNSFAVRNVV